MQGASRTRLDEEAIGDAVQAAASDRSLRGVSFAVDVDPQ